MKSLAPIKALLERTSILSGFPVELNLFLDFKKLSGVKAILDIQAAADIYHQRGSCPMRRNGYMCKINSGYHRAFAV